MHWLYAMKQSALIGGLCGEEGVGGGEGGGEGDGTYPPGKHPGMPIASTHLSIIC